MAGPGHLASFADGPGKSARPASACVRRGWPGPRRGAGRASPPRALSVLATPHDVVSVDEKLAWLSGWFELDVAAAWEWVSSHRTSMQDNGAAVALRVGRSISSRVQRQNGSAPVHAPIATLERLYGFRSPYVAMEIDATSPRDQHWHPVEQGRNWIPAVLAGTPGVAVHDALLRLKASDSNQHARHQRRLPHRELALDQTPGLLPADVRAPERGLLRVTG